MIIDNRMREYSSRPHFKDDFSKIHNVVNLLCQELNYPENSSKTLKTAEGLFILWQEEFPLLTPENIKCQLVKAIRSDNIEPALNNRYFAKVLRPIHKELMKSELARQAIQRNNLRGERRRLELDMQVIRCIANNLNSLKSRRKVEFIFLNQQVFVSVAKRYKLISYYKAVMTEDSLRIPAASTGKMLSLGEVVTDIMKENEPSESERMFQKECYNDWLHDYENIMAKCRRIWRELSTERKRLLT